MPSFQGQTDNVLKIQLQSVLVATHWLQSKVAAGGEAAIECHTAYVGDGAAISLTVKDEGGATIASASGTVHGNLHRSRIRIPADCEAKRLTFEAELAQHGLKGSSKELAVLPFVQIKNLKWLDAQGGALSVLGNDVNVGCEAQILGLPDGEMAHVQVLQKRGAHGRIPVMDAEVPIQQGKASLLWRHGDTHGVEKIRHQRDLSPTGEEYQAPEYAFVVTALGVSAESEWIPHQSFIAYDFGPQMGDTARIAIFVLPDGEECEREVPQDGQLRLENLKPGSVIYQGLKDAAG